MARRMHRGGQLPACLRGRAATPKRTRMVTVAIPCSFFKHQEGIFIPTEYSYIKREIKKYLRTRLRTPRKKNEEDQQN